MRGVMLLSALLMSMSAWAAEPAGQQLATKNQCLACHAVDKKVVGPSYKDVALKYKSDKDALAKLSAKVKKGGAGVWGNIPMPANPQVKDEELKAILQWVLSQK